MCLQRLASSLAIMCSLWLIHTTLARPLVAFAIVSLRYIEITLPSWAKAWNMLRQIHQHPHFLSSPSSKDAVVYQGPEAAPGARRARPRTSTRVYWRLVKWSGPLPTSKSTFRSSAAESDAFQLAKWLHHFFPWKLVQHGAIMNLIDLSGNCKISQNTLGKRARLKLLKSWNPHPCQIRIFSQWLSRRSNTGGLCPFGYL